VAPPKKINFPPIQNGLDYLKSTVEHLSERPTARDLKYAVLHLQAAVEVLLKVRLIREHWTLVFSKPNQASQAAFATGDFTSIGLDDTIARLKGIVGVSLKPQAEHGFKRLSQVRNNLQHFGLVDQAAGIESLAGEVLDSLLVFIRDELVPGADAEDLTALKETQELIAQEIGRLRSLDQARMNRIKDDLDAKADHIVTCPHCDKLTLVLEERAQCLFCDRTWDDLKSLEDLAQEYAWTVLHRSWHDVTEGGEPPVQVCPECGNETLVDKVEIRSEPDLPMWVCFSCQLIQPLGGISPCARCGALMVSSEESGTACSSCWEEAIHSD
jgi:hypothetical protein